MQQNSENAVVRISGRVPRMKAAFKMVFGIHQLCQLAKFCVHIDSDMSWWVSEASAIYIYGPVLTVRHSLAIIH